jgi:secreted trypsin-like serine protease
MRCSNPLAALAMLLLVAACTERPMPVSVPQRPDYIVNGTPTGSAFPSVGALLFDYNKDHVINGDDEWCTGSLVAPDVFLTAAHCKVSESQFMGLQPYWLGLLMNSNATGLGATATVTRAGRSS